MGTCKEEHEKRTTSTNVNYKGINNLSTLTGLTLSCAELSCILSGLFRWWTSRPQDAISEAGAVPWYSKLWQVKHILAEFNPFGAYKSQ